MKTNIILLFTSLLLSIIIADIALRVFTDHPISFTSNRIPDEHLGYRLSSDLADVDTHGFRNDSADSQYDVAAIGDSHTYGDNVKSKDSWPTQFANLSQKSTYNFGVGSYNIYQYFYLIDQAIENSVENVIIAIYPVNDFFSGVCDILHLQYWKKYSHLHDLHRKGCDSLTSYGTKRKFITTMLEYSSIFSVIYHNFLKKRIITRKPFHIGNYVVSRDLMEIHKKDTNIYDDVVADTVKNFEKILNNLSVKATNKGVNLYFMIIPSKQRVLANWAKISNVSLPSEFISIVEQEEQFTKVIEDVIKINEIPLVDATDLLVAALETQRLAGKRIYPKGSGHPNYYGYMAYARAAMELVSEDASSEYGRVSGFDVRGAE